MFYENVMILGGVGYFLNQICQVTKESAKRIEEILKADESKWTLEAAKLQQEFLLQVMYFILFL